jgi:hypothetical protein
MKYATTVMGQYQEHVKDLETSLGNVKKSMDTNWT